MPLFNDFFFLQISLLATDLDVVFPPYRCFRERKKEILYLHFEKKKNDIANS